MRNFLRISCCLDCFWNPAQSSQVTHLTLQFIISLYCQHLHTRHTNSSMINPESYSSLNLLFASQINSWNHAVDIHSILRPKTLNYWFCCIRHLGKHRRFSKCENMSPGRWSAVIINWTGNSEDRLYDDISDIIIWVKSAHWLINSTSTICPILIPRYSLWMEHLGSASR